MAEIPMTRQICVMIIHPRRLPKKGGTKRSMRGDHRNFRVYGNPTNPNMPIVRKSTPDTAIQACKVPPVRARGSPEANPRNVMTAIRRLRKTCRYGEISKFTCEPFKPENIYEKGRHYLKNYLTR
jgi:hypothetical protein